MMKLLKDLQTGNYNPKTNKIKAKTKLIYNHELGHKIWHKKGLNDISDKIYLIWLYLTIIYPLILFIEECFCWYYAIRKTKFKEWCKNANTKK